jgi:diguanylate cyclase (GGDEF)-like protein
MKAAIRITLAYMLISLAWISSSDWLVALAFPDRFTIISIYKGWGFVAVSSVFLYLLIRQDERRRDVIEQTLRRLAVYDPLTGLLNRTCFNESLEAAIAGAERNQTKVGVIFIDIDGFKAVNDRFGHQVGDDLLIEVSRRIKATVRAADVAARFGGDEFLALVIDPQQGEGTRLLCERLVTALARPFHVDDKDITVTASIGYALYPDHGTQCGQLLRAADIAMYRVKATGKNAVGAPPPPIETELRAASGKQ